jgi:outer membrane lipoprotein-sorting protein
VEVSLTLLAASLLLLVVESISSEQNDQAISIVSYHLDELESFQASFAIEMS